MPEPQAIAIIPARGGSKRLPRKNVLPFNGRPIIEYTIDSALDSDCFERVVVSSEDDEILEVASGAGAEVDRRPDELGGDSATVVEVCVDLLQRESALGRRYERLAVLYATAPMRNADDIRSTMALLDDSCCDFALAATPYPHYAHQALSLAEDQSVEPLWPESYEEHPDEIGKVVAGNGSTYCAKVEPFLDRLGFVGPATRAHVMPIARSIDIDTDEEFRLAELMQKINYSR